jgi:hypothetical protein
MTTPINTPQDVRVDFSSDDRTLPNQVERTSLGLSSSTATTDASKPQKNNTRPTHAWGKLPSKEYQESKRRSTPYYPAHVKDKEPSQSRKKKKKTKRRRAGKEGSNPIDDASLTTDHLTYDTPENLGEGSGGGGGGESGHIKPSTSVIENDTVQSSVDVLHVPADHFQLPLLRPPSPDLLLKKAHLQKPGISPDVLTLWWKNIQTQTIGPIIDNKGDYSNVGLI